MEEDTLKINELTELVEAYATNVRLFTEKNNKAASTRARKALGEIGKLVRVQRKAILESRKAE